ncbi:MAG: SulP family inorganic anion transporter [Dongiaceae bacterium]
MDRSAILKAWPILSQLHGYRLAWLRPDVTAGLSVAAVSLPTAIAYPAIAGLPTEVGLFATIFALIGYALLGPSRQLMVGPDTAVCIMLAGVLTTLGATAPADRVDLTLALTLVVGIACFLAGLLRLGFLANFLSRAMLVGFLAGISISLIIGQAKRLTGIEIESHGLIRPIAELAVKFNQVHVLTLAIALGTLLLLRVLRRLAPVIPAPLIAIVAGVGISAAFDLQGHGVAIVGSLPAITFEISWPPLEKAMNLDLLGGALAIMLVGFGSGTITARSFAMKGGSTVDADRELFGFGAANIFSGLFGGFPVTASDSRTAVNYAIGGKTQFTGLIAAATLAVIVLYLSSTLAFLPTATLGAILVSAAIDLIDVRELRTLFRISRSEFTFAIVTLLGVVVVGVLQGVFIAIAATLGHMLWAASRPRLALLGRIPGKAGLYKLHRYPEAEAVAGLTLVVLQAGLVFFNADYVKQRLLKIARALRPGEKWFVLDAAAVNVLDSTGAEALEAIRAYLSEQEIAFGIADLNTRSRRIIDSAGLSERIGSAMIFPSAEAAVATFEALPSQGEPEAAPHADPAAARLPQASAAHSAQEI